MQNKEISSLANPELKFLISLKKNKLRRQEQKSLAEKKSIMFKWFGKNASQKVRKCNTHTQTRWPQ